MSVAGILLARAYGEEELSTKYPPKPIKQVSGSYHDQKIDELLNRSALNQPLFKTLPVVTPTAPSEPAVIAAAPSEQSTSTAEIAKKRESTHQPRLKDLDLSADYKFGLRVYQCTIAFPGVAYRNTPVFADKNLEHVGPQTSEIVIADAVVQGPHSIYLHCVSGNGWLPLSSESGSTMCFKHLGPLSKLQLQDYQICPAAIPPPGFLQNSLAPQENASTGPLLDGKFKFGMRVYECMIDSPGVAYRNTPHFADKRLDGKYPTAPQCVVVDAIIQGKNSLVAHCTNGQGWLPLTDASGRSKRFMMFKHLGEVDDVDLHGLQFAY